MESLIETSVEDTFDFEGKKGKVLSLLNVRDVYVTYRVKVTHPKDYVVRPAISKLPPYGTQDVWIERRSEDLAVEELRSHRFMVQSHEIAAELECSKETWGTFDKAEIRETRFTVDDTGSKLKTILTLHKFGDLYDNTPLRLGLTNIAGDEVFSIDFNPSEHSIRDLWKDVAREIEKEPQCIKLISPDGVELETPDQVLEFLDVIDVMKQHAEKLQTEVKSLKAKLQEKRPEVYTFSIHTILLVAFASGIVGYGMQQLFP